MREILFRGKRVDNGEWVEGHLIWCEDGRARILPSNTDIFCYEMDESIIQTVAHRVIPETVGQYTGLTDKNGTKIFEGDVLRVTVNGNTTICKVAFTEIVAQFQLWQTITLPKTPTALNLGNYECEVIGNIHDNPELLDGVRNG